MSRSSDLVRQMKWQGRTITVRPIQPDDDAQHLAFLGELSPADIRMRVFHSRSSISADELRRLTHIDHEREMAFVAVETDHNGGEQTLGVARAIARPGIAEAEFGIIVRSDLKGGRLGELLMRRLIEQQREHGTRKLVGTVLADNTRMLELAFRLGFVDQPCDEGDGIRCIALELENVHAAI
jgi:acetyltransferase